MAKKQNHESESSALSNAASIVRARVKATPAYRAGRREVIRLAVGAIGPNPTPERLRELGGISAVILKQIERAATPGLSADHGSAMFPLTARKQLASEIGALREEVQILLAGSQP